MSEVKNKTRQKLSKKAAMTAFDKWRNEGMNATMGGCDVVPRGGHLLSLLRFAVSWCCFVWYIFTKYSKLKGQVELYLATLSQNNSLKKRNFEVKFRQQVNSLRVHNMYYIVRLVQAKNNLADDHEKIGLKFLVI